MHAPNRANQVWLPAEQRMPHCGAPCSLDAVERLQPPATRCPPRFKVGNRPPTVKTATNLPLFTVQQAAGWVLPHLQELGDAVLGLLAAEARLLDAAKGRRRIRDESLQGNTCK